MTIIILDMLFFFPPRQACGWNFYAVRTLSHSCEACVWDFEISEPQRMACAPGLVLSYYPAMADACKDRGTLSRWSLDAWAGALDLCSKRMTIGAKDRRLVLLQRYILGRTIEAHIHAADDMFQGGGTPLALACFGQSATGHPPSRSP